MSMQLSNERKGELYCGLQAVLWSVFPVVTVAIIGRVPPILTAALSVFASMLFFACSLTVFKEWHQIRDRRAWKDIALVAIILGVIFYGLMFVGLRSSGAGNGSILALVEIFFSFLFLSVFMRHEPLIPGHIFGATLIVVGAALILWPKDASWVGGEWLIILATAFAPFGNLASKQALKRVNASTVLFWRSTISAVFLTLLSFFLEDWPTTIHWHTWVLIFLNGFIILGLNKVLWMEALRLLTVTKCISLGSATPALTLILAYFFLGEPITWWRIAGFLPIFIGVLLLTRQKAIVEA